MTDDEYTEIERLLEVDPATLTPLQRELLRSIVPPQVNACDGCTMCCTAPAIEQHVTTAPLTAPKPACQQCEYSSGNGCSVYASRPDVCQDYLCNYALGLPASPKPMEVGVCWSFQGVEGAGGMPLLIGHALDVDAAMANPLNRETISHYLATGMVYGVVVRDAKQAVQFVIVDGQPLSRMVDIDPADPLRTNIDPTTERDAPWVLEVEQ
jgi:hypothetical protein